jgi:hypothetical protein
MATATKEKRVRYHKGSVDDAVRAAKKLESKDNLYVFATREGMAIAREKPPFGQQHVMVRPDGTHKTVPHAYVPPETAPDTGIQHGMMGMGSKIHAQKLAAKPVTAGMDDYQKLQEMKEGAKPKSKPEPASDIEVGDFIGLKGEIGKGIRAPRGFVEGEGTIGKNIPAWKVRQGDDSITLIPKADARAIGKPPPPPKGLPKLEKPEPAKPTPKPKAAAKPKPKAKLPTLPPAPEGTISHEDMQILLAGMELKAEAIEERVYRGKAELEAIKEGQDPRLAKLTALIPRTKEGATELTHITKGQYRKVWGREPKPQILTKDGKSVRWEYALDEVAQELHLEDKARREGVNPDEYVKRLIEGALDTKHMIAAMQSEIDSDERTLKAIERLKTGMKTREATVTRGPVTRTIARVEPKARDKSMRVAKQMAKDEALKLVERIQSQRTPAALAMDNAILSQKVVPLEKAHVWAKAPNRYDIRGVDTPSRGRIVAGVGYADKGAKRIARKPRKGWKKVKFT